MKEETGSGQKGLQVKRVSELVTKKNGKRWTEIGQ